jgi:tetratricopeptide (TPR) repeat protein
MRRTRAEPAERALVQDASVVGKVFSRQALSEVSGLSVESVDTLLGSLVRKELLSVQADPRSPERGQYGFLQDLVRRVAYETLSRRERRGRHLAAASYLESAWGAEDVAEVIEVMAAHYLEAYRALPDAPDAGAIRTKAQQALIQAGQRSDSLAALPAALHYYEQAIELTADPVEKAQLQEAVGHVGWAAARVPEVRAHLEEAIETYRRSGMVRDAARAVGLLAEFVWQDGKFEEALVRMQDAFEVLSQGEQDAGFAYLASQLGRQLFFVGQPGPALEKIEIALELAETLQLSEILSQGLNTKALVLASRGRIQESMLLMRHAVEVAREHDLKPATLRGLNNLSSLEEGLERYEEALRLAAEALELARLYGDRSWERKFLVASISSLVNIGRWDEALARAAEFEETDDVESFFGQTEELYPLVAVHGHRGDLGKAQALFQSLRGTREVQEIQLRGLVALTQAELALAEGDAAGALPHGDMAMELGRELGFTSGAFRLAAWAVGRAALELGDLDRAEHLVATLRTLRPGETGPTIGGTLAWLEARLAAARGDTETAEGRFAEAARRFRQGGTRFMLAVTLLEQSEWLLEVGRSEAAEPALAEAGEIFTELGARPWLERLARAAPDESRPAGRAVTAGDHRQAAEAATRSVGAGAFRPGVMCPFHLSERFAARSSGGRTSPRGWPPRSGRG